MSFVPVAQTFVLNQSLVSVGGDLWIDDVNGQRVFEVDGKAIAIRRTLVLKDMQGSVLYQINQSLGHLRRTFEIKRGDQVVVTIQKSLVSFFGDNFTVTAANGDTLAIKGDWIAREFRITNGGQDVIVASRKLVSLHGGYAVQIAPSFDVPMGLAIVVALEQIELEEGHR
jgi:uncharacterized protein YxjI